MIKTTQIPATDQLEIYFEGDRIGEELAHIFAILVEQNPEQGVLFFQNSEELLKKQSKYSRICVAANLFHLAKIILGDCHDTQTISA